MISITLKFKCIYRTGREYFFKEWLKGLLNFLFLFQKRLNCNFLFNKSFNDGFSYFFSFLPSNFIFTFSSILKFDIYVKLCVCVMCVIYNCLSRFSTHTGHVKELIICAAYRWSHAVSPLYNLPSQKYYLYTTLTFVWIWCVCLYVCARMNIIILTKKAGIDFTIGLNII